MTPAVARLLVASLPASLRLALDRLSARGVPPVVAVALARSRDPDGLLAPAVAAYLTARGGIRRAD